MSKYKMDDGPPFPSNIIVLEPEIAARLEAFIKKTLYPDNTQDE